MAARASVNPTQDYQFMNRAQLEKEIERCLNCTDKPCMHACPAKCSAADFIMRTKMQKPQDFERAAAEIYALNPLGGICGVACPDKFCMAACTRKNLDEPVNIPAIQATIVHEAHKQGHMPQWPTPPEKPNTKENKVAVIGAGPSGLSCAAMLAAKGYHVSVFERKDVAFGDAAFIPKFRMPQSIMDADLKFVMSLGDIQIKYRTSIENPNELLERFGAVANAVGVQKDVTLNIPGAEAALTSRTFLGNPEKYVKDLGHHVVVLGGGAVAVDVACVLKKQGVERVTVVYRRSVNDMPVDQWERDELRKFGVDVVGRTLPKEIFALNGKVTGIRTVRVDMPTRSTGKADTVEVAGSEQVWTDVTGVVFAVGLKRATEPLDAQGVFACGDFVNGASTVVEAVASGKKAAHEIDCFLSNKKEPVPAVIVLPNHPVQPVDLTTDFYGFKMKNPFMLSAAPNSDGLEEMRKALKAGWAGGVMKTAFDGVPIHIPNEYMKKFAPNTYGNCDNVSGHPLDRVCAEIKILRKEFPDRLIIGATGGPLTGNLEFDKAGWQGNTRKLDQSGAMAVEYSLSCPQGGDGSEGAIASQSVKVTQRIVDWVMEASDPNIPKFFKMTAAVTSINVIVSAVKEVLAKYPNKHGGVTLANSFPSMGFRPRTTGTGVWEEGVTYGMAGKGVLPISYLSLATVINTGVAVSGNGGVFDYEAAANMLALGATNVQICTLAMVEGVEIISELTNGLSYLLKQRGIKSVSELIGVCRPNPIADFMDLTPKKQISCIDYSTCIQCGNCTRCPYLAISWSDKKIGDKVVLDIDAAKCVGCSMCILKCPSHSMSLRERTPEEAKVTSH